MNAILSRCALFMFACILNTNAENFSLKGSMISSPAILGSGGIVMRRKLSKNGSMPKLFSAEPKNTGLSLPERTSSIENS